MAHHRVAGTCVETATAALLVVCGASTTLHGQVSGTVDAGASWMDYEGFLGSGAAYFTPTLRYDSPEVSLGASGSLVVFESGNQIVQGLAAGAWRAPFHEGWHAELSGSAGINAYEDVPGYGHFLGRARLHYARGRTGGWLGGATGQSYDGAAAATPLAVEVGSWTVQGDLGIAATATRTWLADTAYLDVVGAARWRDPFLEINGTLGFRTWSEGGGSGAYGELHMQIGLWNHLAALVSGGRYPSDPARGVIAANYISIGVRITAFTAAVSPSPTPTRALLRELDRREPARVGEARLIVRTATGPMRTVLVEAPGATSVEISGDFTDWRPVSLARRDGDAWRLVTHIASGVHRVNVRVNGGPWLVPTGLRGEDDGFGGRVGVLVIP